MTRTARIRRFLGDGEHEFRIGVGEAEELDERFGLGLLQVFEAITMVRTPVIREVVRLARIGAGLDREKAHAYAARYVVDGYFAECAAVAGDVVRASLTGVIDDPPGEGEGDGQIQTRSPAAE